MVLPAPAADDPQGPEDPDWAYRVARLVGLAERGILILVDGAVPSRLRDLVLALLPEHPEVEIHTDPRPLLDAPEGSTVVLAPSAEHASWLNINRPLFADRKLRVVLFSDAETSRALARQATDFFDWVSHRVDCSPGEAPFVMAGIRASVVARAPGVVWEADPAGFERALQAAFPGRQVQWFDSESPDLAMLLSAKARGPDWLGFDDGGDAAKLDTFQDILAALHKRGRAVLVRPRQAPPGWHRIATELAELPAARARMEGAGAPFPGRLVALTGLEPGAVDLLESLLSRSAVPQAEIEPRLRDASDPGAVLARLAVDRGLIARDAFLPPVLRAFAADPEARRRHEPPTRRAPDAIRAAISELRRGEPGLEELYRRTVEGQYACLKSFTHTGRSIDIPLDKVYVELKAVADTPDVVDSYGVEERRMLFDAERAGRSQGDIQADLDSLRLARWSGTSRSGGSAVVRRSIEELMADTAQRGIVILGDPGSGKTTLLHYLALRAARGDATDAKEPGLSAALRTPDGRQRVPIFIPLAAYDDHLQRAGEGASLREYLSIHHAKRQSLPGLDPLFQAALDEGRALLLLDGLDEVLDLGRRIRIASDARAMISQEAGKGNRFVITSRFIGYREAPLPDDLLHVNIVPFGETEIELFVHRWCEASQIAESGGRSTDVVLQRAHAWEKDLLADLKANPSVRALSENPLLLTMLARIRWQNGGLSRHRIEIYREYVEMLLDNAWEHARSDGARSVPPTRFPSELAIEYLIGLSFWLHENRPAGTARRSELEAVLVEIGLRMEGVEPDDASAKARIEATRNARRFMQDMRQFAGILAERGRDAYGFLHLTLQEYFVGRALARMGTEERWAFLRAHLHLPRWKEPILLCAGWLGVVEGRRGEVGDLVRRILGAGSQYEDLLHRDVFLAADVAGDDVGVEEALVSELVTKLIERRSDRIPAVQHAALQRIGNFARTGHEESITYLGRLLEEAPERQPGSADIYGVVASLIASPPCKRLLDQAVRDLRKHAAGMNAYGLFSALAQIARSRDDLRHMLIQEMLDSTGLWNPAEAALKSLVHDHRDVRDVFLALTKWPGARQPAVQVLVDKAWDDSRIRELALEWWDDDGRLKQVIAPAAARSFETEPMWRKRLLDALDSSDGNTSNAVVAALTSVARRSPAIRASIRAHAEKRLLSKNPSEASNALGAMSRLAEVEPEADTSNVILSMLDDPRPVVQQQALRHLSGSLVARPELQDRMKPYLDHPNREMREIALTSMAPFALGDAAVKEAFVRNLHQMNACPMSVRIDTMGPMSADAIVRPGLELHLDAPDGTNRTAAAKAMTMVLNTADGAPEDIVRRIGDPVVDRPLIHALRKKGFADERSIDLVLRLTEGKEQWVAGEAASMLAPFAHVPQVRQRLIELFDHGEGHAREMAAAALAPLYSEDDEVRARMCRLAVTYKVSSAPEMQDTARLLKHFAIADVAILQRTREAVQRIPDMMRHLDFLAARPETQEEYFRARRGSIAHLDLLAAYPRELDGFQILMALRYHPYYMVRQRALRGLTPWMDDVAEVRSYVFEQARTYDTHFRGKGGWDFTIEQVAIEALSARLDRDDEARALLIEIASTIGLSSRIVVETAQALALHVSTKPEIEAVFRWLIANGRAAAEHFGVARCVVAAAGLSTLAARDRELQEQLLPWLGARCGPQHHEAQEARMTLARTLAPLVAEDMGLRDTLIGMLDSPAWQDRQGAGWTLMLAPGDKPPELLTKLRGLLHDGRAEESWQDRLQVAEVFLNHRDMDLCRQAVDVAREALAYGKEPWCRILGDEVRARAAVVLAKLEPVDAPPALMAQLHDALLEESSGSVRSALYSALLRLAAVPQPPHTQTVLPPPATVASVQEASQPSPIGPHPAPDPESLSGSQKQQLHNALIEAFPTQVALERMLLFQLDKNLHRITTAKNLDDAAFELIKTAIAEGWVMKLLAAAREANPGNARLASFAEQLSLATHSAPPAKRGS
jgi:hypothetical protein